MAAKKNPYKYNSTTPFPGAAPPFKVGNPGRQAVIKPLALAPLPKSPPLPRAVNVPPPPSLLGPSNPTYPTMPRPAFAPQKPRKGGF